MICALVAAGCDISEMSSLKDLSRPYAGEYKCRKLQLGSEDVLGQFEYVKLDLAYGGAFILYWRDTSGGENAYEGKYKLSEENSTVTLSSEAGGKEMTYVFPYTEGKVTMELLFNEKLLLAEFSMVE